MANRLFKFLRFLDSSNLPLRETIKEVADKLDKDGIEVSATITAGGTVGAQTINKPSGTVNIAAGQATLVVTNNLVKTTSIVLAVVRTNDTTALIKNVIPAAGSFTIRLNANATAETSVGFIVIN